MKERIDNGNKIIKIVFKVNPLYFVVVFEAQPRGLKGDCVTCSSCALDYT